MSNEADDAKDSNTGRLALTEFEIYWRDHYNWLLECGYRLRQRYHPEWVPSWKKDTRLSIGLTEDSVRLGNGKINDAIRISDEAHVVLKRVSKADHPNEAKILQYLSQEPQASDRRNRCVPLLELLQPPDDEAHEIIVMPILREFNEPDFDTIGEVLDFLRQILEGFAFLHEHRIAHRDIKAENILMVGTSLYREKFHFVDPTHNYELTAPLYPSFTRTERPTQYYLTDFGFSSQYTQEEMPPSELPRFATDISVPEFQDRTKSSDPFPIDVYYVGNFIRMDFIDGYPESMPRNTIRGLEFLRPLVDEMTKELPSERITMQKAQERLEEIISTLNPQKLRSRPIIVRGDGVPEDPPGRRIRGFFAYWTRRAKFTVRRVPAIPVPPDSGTTKDTD